MILRVAAFGPVRLPDLTGIPDLVWFAVLAVVAGAAFRLLRGARLPATPSENSPSPSGLPSAIVYLGNC